MDAQLSSILKYWYLLPKERASVNCDRIITSTALLFLTLWTISTAIHLSLGSVHARHWIRRSLFRLPPDRVSEGWTISEFLLLTSRVNTLGTSVVQICFSLVTARILRDGFSRDGFNNALALWLLRPTASSLINIISLIVSKETYSDAAIYTTSGEFALGLLSIWPFAFIGGATRHIDELTQEFLLQFNIPSSAIPLLKAGSAFGILHWIAFMYLNLTFFGVLDFKIQTYPVLRPIPVALNLGRLGASCFLWLGALQIVGNAQVCVFYLDPAMVRWILVLWTAEPLVEALWNALFPSFIPFVLKDGINQRIVMREWKEPAAEDEMQNLSA